jgi:hypothetical protein
VWRSLSSGDERREIMTLLRPLLLLCGIVLAIAVTIVTFGGKSAQQEDPGPRPATPVDSVMAAKAQDHCWFSVKRRSPLAKAAAGGRALSGTSAGAQRVGDLILVTGTIEPAVGDDRFYGCALYEYTEGSPVVVSATTSSSPPGANALIPAGFTSDGKRQ